MGRLLIVASFVLVCAVWAEPECQSIHRFLSQTSYLLRSLPTHTYPVFTLCTNSTAIHEYRNATELYRNMTMAPECQKYLGHNRMNVYETIYGQLTGLWASANCDACAGALNETTEFMAQSATLERCLASTPNPCDSCDAQYQRVQALYGRLEKDQHGPDRICFDIADRMNQTRRAWSGQYNCCKDKRRSMVTFAAIGSVACALPVLFYVVLHIVAVRREARHTLLLSETSVEEVSQPSGSGNGVRPAIGRQPEMARFVETDDDDDDDGATSDGSIASVDRIDKERSKVNNLNMRESQLIDLAPEETVTPGPVFAAKADDVVSDTTNDESMLE